MANLKDYFKPKKRNVSLPIKILTILLVILIAAFIYFTFSDTRDKSEPAASVSDDNVEIQEFSVEDITFLEENDIITGIHNIKIEQGTDISLSDLINFDKNYVSSLTVDDSNVDYDKEGEYKATYAFTLNGEKLREFLKAENANVPFDMACDTISLKVPVTVTIINEEAAEEEAAKGNEVITSDSKIPSKDKISQGNNSKDKDSSGASNGSSNTSDASGSSSNTQSNHKHVWAKRTETVQEPQTIIVTEEKEYYTLYRFYWYNTDTWEESKDSDRFNEWTRSENGQLYPLKHPYAKPEDNPLFKGYDSNGNPTYTNDHSIISNLFDWVPCEPYEKTEMVAVKRTVTYCSVCGATK